MTQRLTALIALEEDIFVATCPEYDVTSQGDSVESAVVNLKEVVELFFECADREEIVSRRSSEIFITQLEVAVGQT